LRLKTAVQHAVKAYQEGESEILEKLVAEEPGAMRYLLSMTYQDDPEKRNIAAKGIAFGSKHHPRLAKDLVRRLIWAMNDESGTNALTAPDVLVVLAEVNPEILLPMVPDMTRLTADPGLKDGLTQTLETVAEKCPGQVGERLSRSLKKRLRKGSAF